MILASKVIAITYIFILIALSAPILPAAAETLADIDAEIQRNPVPIRIAGQDAYNVYEGATASRLDRKIAILNAAGIKNFAAASNYSNFYSFTANKGFTDTKIDIVTTKSPLRLYRRGSSSVQETQRYLGSWWSGSYLGVEATRNQQAVLSAWGSDLQRIYVIDAPAGVTLIGGNASPMEHNGEYRAGGAYQYYYRGVPLQWLVYALYAPDYIGGYAAAITGAQKIGRNGMEDLGGHLDELRYRELNRGAVENSGSYSGQREAPVGHIGTREKASMKATDLVNVWANYYGGYARVDGSGEYSQNSYGIHGGWEKLAFGGSPGERDRRYFGAVIGQGFLRQKQVTSDVNNDIRNTYAGLYTVYQKQPNQPRSWYSATAVYFGRLDFTNKTPGELGYGLNQSYSGNIFAASFETGLTYRRHQKWFIEPQVQLIYTRVLQGDFRDQLGAEIKVKHDDSLLSRLGVMALRQRVGKDGLQTKQWIRASYFHEFLGRNEVEVAGDIAVSQGGRNFYQINAGIDLPVNPNLIIRMDISRMFGDEHGYHGNLALQCLW